MRASSWSSLALTLLVAGSAAAVEPRNVAIVVYPGVELLDFAGPGEVFSAAGNGAFNVFTVAATKEPLVSQGFVRIVPDHAIADSPKPDILVLPGGSVGSVQGDAAFMSWIKQSSGQAEITMSVCNGALILAQAGLLDGLKATTHWGALPALRRYPRITVAADERFTDNGRVLSTQGVSAGIDGALHVVERLLGGEAAWADARYMMYRWEPATLSSAAKDELRPWIERDWPAVERVYQRKLARSPKDALALTRLGIAQEESGQHARAVATLEQALALGSRDPDALDDLGDARLALGQYETAASLYEREIPLRAARQQSRTRLSAAKAWLRAGKKDAALAVLRPASAQLSRKTLQADPALAELQADPRFAALLLQAAP